MNMDPEALYRQLGQLIAETPADLTGVGPVTQDMQRWLARAAALVDETDKEEIVSIESVGYIVLSDFAVLAPENVRVLLLADSFTTKPDVLRPVLQRWRQQYGAARPLEIRLTAPRLLHDRLIILDRADAWSLSQSLKDFANRAAASVLHVEDEVAHET